MFLTVIYTPFSHIINYFVRVINYYASWNRNCIFLAAVRFAVIVMLHNELYLLDRVWNAPTSSAGTSIVVLRYGSCGKKDSSWHTKSATLRRDVATTSLLHPTLHWKSDFLLFGPEIGSRGSPSHHRGRDEDVRLIGDTRVWFASSFSLKNNISMDWRREVSPFVSGKNFLIPIKTFIFLWVLCVSARYCDRSRSILIHSWRIAVK